MIADIQPWEQYPNESAQAFRAFNLYKRLTPQQRSVNAAWRKYNPEQALVTPDASGSFAKWPRKYHWKERAEAWDRNLEHVQDKTHEAAVEKDMLSERTRRRAMLNVLANFISQYGNSLAEAGANHKLKPTEIRGLASVVQIYAEQSRREYNDLDGDHESDQSKQEQSATQGLRQKIQQDLAKATASGETGSVPKLVQ